MQGGVGTGVAVDTGIEDRAEVEVGIGVEGRVEVGVGVTTGGVAAQA